MIELLLSIIVLAIVAYAVYVLINWLPLPPPIKTVVLLLFAVIVLLALAGLFGVGPGTGLKLG
jgi:hypothetical protein